MIGIVSYGGYIPRLRLSRKSVAQNVSWLVHGVSGLAHGEKSLCNWDEDSITMAVAAARDCLAGTDKKGVDAVYCASTTLPFSDRLNAGIIATALNLREDLVGADFTSCQKAATTALVTALGVLQGGSKRTVLVTAADRREAKPGSPREMLYGDGAASVLVGNENVIAEFEGSYSLCQDFVDHYRGEQRRTDYVWEDRWIKEEGYAKIIPQAINGLLSKLGTEIGQVDRLIFPCPQVRDHAAIARQIGISPERVSGNLFQDCGETGAAHPLVMLAAALAEARPGERIVVASFGQGSDALSFKATDRIHDLTARRGVGGTLANKQATENYVRYLSFRDLVQMEMGIRAEAPNQTSLSTLWRKRKLIMALVGGKCRQCGTPQLPKMDICVNPECGAMDSQDDYEFADVPGIVKSFTGDMLTVSFDPPAIYGVIEFAGGGRFLADFTDCDVSDLEVGTPVEMSFRRHLVDKQRGFTGYFWKAVPRIAGV